MVWALLALVGVPIWLVVGALGAALWSRRSSSRQPGVFRATARPATGPSWPRHSVYVRVAHDVLVVTSRLAPTRTAVHGVRRASVEAVQPDSIAGMRRTAALRLGLDRGGSLVLATESALDTDPSHRGRKA